jgi:hypothetical protein
MRALRVVGLGEDGETVICEDPGNGERFSVPADERLRAAARGDLTRLGQVQIEMEAQMRPREIQARIRAGASVEQVASAAGIPEHRVERYAYPVLLERAQTAEMAQRAHPIREDGPDVQTLAEVVSHTFAMRGHEYADGGWDSWRGDDGKWVIQLRWQAGRSENRAHWVFHPGAQGGTVTAVDDHAADLLDPSPNRPLRTVRPVTALAREALGMDQQPEPEKATADEPVPVPEPPAAPKPSKAPKRKEQAATIPALDLDPAQLGRTAPDLKTEPESGNEPETAATQRAEAEPTEESDEKAKETPKRGRKNHPIVPSWEDVLLGVRSNR